MNNNHRETLRFLFIYVTSCGSIRCRSSTESEFYYIGFTAFLEIRIFFSIIMMSIIIIYLTIDNSIYRQ